MIQQRQDSIDLSKLSATGWVEYLLHGYQQGSPPCIGVSERRSSASSSFSFHSDGGWDGRELDSGFVFMIDDDPTAQTAEPPTPSATKCEMSEGSFMRVRHLPAVPPRCAAGSPAYLPECRAP